LYHVPVAQGNIVTGEQVELLEKGMTKKQVAYILGTPLVASPFDANRWDYVFYFRNPRAHERQSALRLYFSGDRLTSIEGDQEYAIQAKRSDADRHAVDSTPLPGETGALRTPMGDPDDPMRDPSDAQDDKVIISPGDEDGPAAGGGGPAPAEAPAAGAPAGL